MLAWPCRGRPECRSQKCGKLYCLKLLFTPCRTKEIIKISKTHCTSNHWVKLFFWSWTVQFHWACAQRCLRFLFLANRSRSHRAFFFPFVDLPPPRFCVLRALRSVQSCSHKTYLSTLNQSRHSLALTPVISRAFPPTDLTCPGYLHHFCVNSGDMLHVKIPADQRFLKHSNHLVLASMPQCLESYFSPILIPSSAVALLWRHLIGVLTTQMNGWHDPAKWVTVILCRDA